ncbi:MAG: extracellular solute-binding protein [Streptosporangiales bacterium]|nr:extracellular solute-binding protein [Streptosporangiales bacterium]
MRRAAATTGLAFVTAIGLLAGCTGGATQSSGGNEDTLTYLIGQPEDPEQVTAIKSQIKKFEKQHPGKHVKLNVMPNDQLRTVLQTQLQSGKGPDIFSYDTGPGFAGVLAEAGLLYDLSDAYKKNDWPIYDWAKQRVTFGGKVVGVPDQVEEIGLFYNKDMFAKHGIDEPKNLADLEAGASKLSNAGVTPIAFSNKEGWEAGHALSAPLSSAVGPKVMQDLIEGKKSWDSPEVVDAIELFFVDYRKKGFLPKSPNAITYDNANALLYKQKAGMTLTGSWLAHDIEKSAEFDVGFMPFPSESGPGYPAAGLGSGTFVSAKTANPDLAVKYLDFVQTQEHGKWQVEQMKSIPAFPVKTDDVQATPLFRQILDDTSSIASGEGKFGYNIDVLMKQSFNKAMWDGLQGVLVDQKTPKECAADMADAYEKPGK